MRRGWILSGGLTCIVVGSMVVWWWSNPGQAWLLRKTYAWWVVPMTSASPGGADIETLCRNLDPYWSRLIARRHVTPYSYRWDSPTEAEIATFCGRLDREVTCPLPNDLAGRLGTARMLNGKQVAMRSAEGTLVFTVTLLLPPNQHPILARIASDVFGSEGSPAPDEIPAWWLPPVP